MAVDRFSMSLGAWLGEQQQHWQRMNGSWLRPGTYERTTPAKENGIEITMTIGVVDGWRKNGERSIS